MIHQLLLFLVLLSSSEPDVVVKDVTLDVAAGGRAVHHHVVSKNCRLRVFVTTEPFRSKVKVFGSRGQELEGVEDVYRNGRSAALMRTFRKGTGPRVEIEALGDVGGVAKVRFVECPLVATSKQLDDWEARCEALRGSLDDPSARDRSLEELRAVAAEVRGTPGWRASSWLNDMLSIVAWFAARMGNVDLVLEGARDSAAFERRVCPDGHPFRVEAEIRLGGALVNAGLDEDGLELLERQIEHRDLMRRYDDRMEMSLLGNLCVSLAKVGRVREAVVFGWETMEGLEARLAREGERNDAVLGVANLVQVLNENGRHEEACVLVDEAFRLARRHEVAPWIVEKLRLARARSLKAAGRIGEALPEFERLAEESYPATSEWVIANTELSSILGELEEIEKARALDRRIWSVQRRAPITDERVMAAINLSMSEFRCGDEDRALDLLEEVEEEARGVLLFKINMLRIMFDVDAGRPDEAGGDIANMDASVAPDLALRSLATVLDEATDKSMARAKIIEVLDGERMRLRREVPRYASTDVESEVAVLRGALARVLLARDAAPDVELACVRLAETLRSAWAEPYRVKRLLSSRGTPEDAALLSELRAVFRHVASGRGVDLARDHARLGKLQRDLGARLEVLDIGEGVGPATDDAATVTASFWECLDEAGGPARLLAWTWRKGGVRRLDLGDLESLTREADDLRRCIAGGLEGPALDAVVRVLRERLVDPLLDGTAPQRLRLVPSASVATVPFSLLVGADGPVVVGTPSLCRSAVTDAGPGGLLLVGNLDYGGGRDAPYARLPGTRAEIRALAALYRDRHGEKAPLVVLEEKGADVAAFADAARGARIVHVATHGWFSESLERADHLDAFRGVIRTAMPFLASGLALSDANVGLTRGAPRIIRAEEIAGLDLSRCELAVLSACDTAVGLRRGGMGLASLQQALHAAGARHVVASLWKVSDEAAAEFMKLFYRALWDGRETSVESALRSARRAMRDARCLAGTPVWSARDWAAWTLSSL